MALWRFAADQPEIQQAAQAFRAPGVSVDAGQIDLATREGVDQLYAAARGRPVDALLANAGHGQGRALLDQDFADIRHGIDTNITGTSYLIHKVVRDMRARNQGRVLITGSIAGPIPGPFQAIYHGSKAFFEAMLKGEGVLRRVHEQQDTNDLNNLGNLKTLLDSLLVEREMVARLPTWQFLIVSLLRVARERCRLKAND